MEKERHVYYELGELINAEAERGLSRGEAIAAVAKRLGVEYAEVAKVIALGPPSDRTGAWW